MRTKPLENTSFLSNENRIIVVTVKVTSPCPASELSLHLCVTSHHIIDTLPAPCFAPVSRAPALNPPKLRSKVNLTRPGRSWKLKLEAIIHYKSRLSISRQLSCSFRLTFPAPPPRGITRQRGPITTTTTTTTALRAIQLLWNFASADGLVGMSSALVTRHVTKTTAPSTLRSGSLAASTRALNRSLCSSTSTRLAKVAAITSRDVQLSPKAISPVSRTCRDGLQVAGRRWSQGQTTKWRPVQVLDE